MDMIEQIIEWRDEALRPQAHRDRWDRCLVMLGEANRAKKTYASMSEEELKRLALRPWGGRWKQVLRYYESKFTSNTVTVKASNTDSASHSVSVTSNSSPNTVDYEKDYKDACNTINQLRSELGKVKQRLRNAEHQAKTRGDYGQRQYERAENLEQRLKDTNSMSDTATSDYQELHWKYQTLQNEFTSYKQGQKIDYADAMRFILTGAVVDTNNDSVKGADKLTAQDWLDIDKMYRQLGIAKSQIDVWLWDITHTPSGKIGERYKGTQHDADMGYYVHRIDGLVHSAYQMMGAVQDYIKRGSLAAGRT